MATFEVTPVTTIPSADLCAGLVTDKVNRPMSQTAVIKPAVGQSFVDPDFGTTIRRVSDASAIGKTYVKTMYSTQPAWNADESLLLLLGSGYEHLLYNGKTYQFIRNISNEINPSDGEQVMWDNTNPQVLYYMELSSHHVLLKLPRPIDGY
jgi:hypothetical protein